MKKNVAIIGASKKPDRYSYKAFQELLAGGYNPIPINPVLKDIEGVPCYSSLESCPEKIDIITIYVRPSVLADIVPQIINVHPGRVIFNPGTEDEDIMEKLTNAGIKVQTACTIVLLKTNQFDD
ncbi:MAG: CoA-binding protein [Kiritimatiellae bacterium]|jgi:predicted CoA-binding protein|nr:CoA-binding protein [Kiritimatiellia bacterium]